MKNTPVSLRVAVLVLAAFLFAPSPRADAEVDRDATIALLTSGPWKISGKNWTVIRTFNKDETFTSQGGKKAHGHWSIENNAILLDFSDKHKETMTLPLDPKGSPGSSDDGVAYTCALVSAIAASNTPPPASKPAGGAGKGAFGSANPDAAASQAPPSTLSPELQQKAADLVKTYHNSLVFVTGKDASGSGFIAALGGSNFLFTNAHVAAGISDAAFKTLDDTPVKGGAASVAVGRDVFCMVMPAGGTPLQIMQDVEGNAAIGDDVVVLGNAGGGGVINTITGKIVGIGPDRIEIDAPIVHGNSGSPIIHLKSGKVIGIATYAHIVEYDQATGEKLKNTVVRRFGYRIDNVKSWQAVNWKVFYAQAAEMNDIEARTSDLDNLFDDLDKNKGRPSTDQYTTEVIKNSIDQWIADRTGKLSVADKTNVDSNFYSKLKSACQSDVAAARQHMTYDYFQRELAEHQRTRDGMTKAFADAIKELGD